MPDTHDHGRLYWHWQHYRKPYGFLAWTRFLRRRGPRPVKVEMSRPPLLERATTRMVEEPYRTGNGLSMRLWPTRYAIVAGWWGKDARGGQSETELLEKALFNGGMMPVTAVADMRQWRGTNRRWKWWARYRAVRGWIARRGQRVSQSATVIDRRRSSA